MSDIEPIRNLRPGETFMRADISKMSDMLRITKGVDQAAALWRASDGDFVELCLAQFVADQTGCGGKRRSKLNISVLYCFQNKIFANIGFLEIWLLCQSVEARRRQAPRSRSRPSRVKALESSPRD